MTLDIPIKKIELQFFDTKPVFEGFEISGHFDVKVFRKGDLRSNGKTRVTRNAITIKRDYPEDGEIDACIRDFLDAFGALNSIHSIKKSLKPTKVFLRLYVPAISSELIQDMNISIGNLKRLVDEGLSLDFWFT